MTQAWDQAGFGSGDAVVVPYENTARSIEKVAQIARETRHDADVRGWAIDRLREAGYDGRIRTATPRQTAQVLLDAVRANTTYVPDPHGSEWIQKPHVTLCLRDKCIRGGDCFACGTQVLRDDFSFVDIEEIHPGERIWGYDKWTTVVAVVDKGLLYVDHVFLNNGSKLCLTSAHNVYLASGERWRVNLLKDGHQLLQPPKIGVGEGDPTWLRGLYQARKEEAAVQAIVRRAAEVECVDIQTEDHYVYLPEADVTVSNCDDLVALLLGLLLSVGQPCYAVKQEFGASDQEHVLVGIIDGGHYYYADPANTTRPVYEGSRATHEDWVDPLDQTGANGLSGAEFVTLGRAPVTMTAPTVKSIANPQLEPQVGVGATVLGFESVGEIDQLDAQVNGAMLALQAAAQACTGTLSQSDQDALAGFVSSWTSLHNQWQSWKSSTFTWWNPGGAIAGAVVLQFMTISSDMRGYIPKIADWQARLKSVCSNYTPPPGITIPTPAPNVPTPITQTAEIIIEAAKAVGSVLAVGAAVYVGYLGVQLLRELPRPK